MENPGRVEPSLAWHGRFGTRVFAECQLNYLRASPRQGRPPDNRIKGVSQLPALTLHTTPSVSREWLAAPDAEITALLLDAARQHAALAVEAV